MPRIRCGVLCLLLVLLCSGSTSSQDFPSGAAQIKSALDRLNVLGSVLMIGAHPDDENTALLAYFARGRHLRTAYLSLTRGEGGQNLLGSEQGERLGLIRTQELLAARRIDGAEQFFTSAVDFGFTKSAEETFDKWGREKTLAETVLTIRRFQPDVIILQFTGTGRDGHGQHQVSGIVGREAYAAAADPHRFPEQLTEVKPWQAKRLLQNVWTFTADQAKAAAAMPARLELEVGEFNPVLGRSYSELAALSRSQHRSQAMGSRERRGAAKNYLVTIAGEPAANDPLDGVETGWKRVEGGAGVGEILARTAASLDISQPERSLATLLEARGRIKSLADPWARRKLRELDEAAALCGGLWADASADRYAAVPGEPLELAITVISRSHYPARLIGIGLEGMPDMPRPEIATASLAYNSPATQTLRLMVPRTQKLAGAEDPPPLKAKFRIGLGDSEIELERDVIYRYVEPARGELTRPLTVVPQVSVTLPQSTLIFPDNKAQRLPVQVKANAAGRRGTLRLLLEPGWQVEPTTHAFQLREIGDQAEVIFQVTPPGEATVGRAQAVAEVGGEKISSGVEVVSYPHIQPQTIFPPAVAKLVRLDVRNLASRVAYVEGAGDEVAQALTLLGCRVSILSDEDLAQRDLAEFDAVVTGVRAYNVRPALRAAQARLMDYVSKGGTLVVQYNVAEGGPGNRGESATLSKIGPYPLRIGRARVSVEEAPVRFTNPTHILLASPNRITAQDFDGWIQERGLYFASDWDPHYEAMIESSDPGENPLPGGILYSKYGKGVYIFTAYSWFRQLPAGVPGAYRLFANMLSAAKVNP